MVPNNQMMKKMKGKYYIMAVVMLITATAAAQTEDENIKRTVTLYNPYKPTLHEAVKRTLLPSDDDTTTVDIRFSYDFTLVHSFPNTRSAP